MKTKSQLFSGLIIIFGIFAVTTGSASETPRKSLCSQVCCKRAIKRLTKAASDFVASFQGTPTTMLDLEMEEFTIDRENGLRRRHPSQVPGTPDYGIPTPSSFQTDTEAVSPAPSMSAQFGGQAYNLGPASSVTTGDCVTTAAGGDTSPFFTRSFPLPVFPSDQ